MAQPSVSKLYQSVIDEVIESMREAVLDEGIDEQVLTELKQLWEQKLKASKALEAIPTPSHYPIPPQSNTSRRPAAASASSQVPQALPMVATPLYRPTAVRTHLQAQPIDMSGPAATATMALPAMYQQQLLAGNIQIQHNSSGGITAVIPASAIQPGNISLHQQQQHAIQQIQPQNLSTKVQGQLDGAEDVDGEVTAGQADPQQAHDLCCRPRTTVPRYRRRKTRDIEVIVQLDGADTSSEDDDDIEDDDEDDVENDVGDDEGDEEPLNSEDDDADAEESTNLFEMDNVIVCQYDKITRSKNRWRFTLKDGIMNINTKDYVFQKAHGEAEW